MKCLPSSHSIYLIEYKKTGKEDDEEEAEILADEKKMMTRGFGRRKSKHEPYNGLKLHVAADCLVRGGKWQRQLVLVGRC